MTQLRGPSQSYNNLLREVERLRDFVSELAEDDCAYGDDCPTFGSRHGKCTRCKAREALRLPQAKTEGESK